MTRPPERISIKRRRQDEPVETLILESDLARDNKRRFTNFYFQRLRHNAETTGPISTSGTGGAVSTVSTNNVARDYQDLGIPLVRASAPGDEVRDFAKYRAAQMEKQSDLSHATIGVAGARDASPHRESAAINTTTQTAASKRRFHLMRDLSAVLHEDPKGLLRRPNALLRPPVATFMEKPGSSSIPVHLHPPVDRIIELGNEPDASQIVAPLSEDSITGRTEVSTFLKTTDPSTKRGYSIRDDPTTWDQDSDQLANELAALAFEIDPADATEPPQVLSPARHVAVGDIAPKQITDEPMIVDNDNNDFIFETYIRVKHDLDVELGRQVQNSEVGVLVIDDENEDLWEKYVRSEDDDTDWDEEDEDSNAEDNPRNDYPDEDASSDDELGRNVYQHRRQGSDDEEYYER